MLKRLLRAIIKILNPRYFFPRIMRRRPNTYKPVVLITGCGSGLGLAMAELFASILEFRVVITARIGSMETLRQKFPESDRVMVKIMDVTSETDRAHVCNEIMHQWGGVDILINNAGIAYRAVVEHMTEANEIHQIATNYLGPMGLIRQVVRHMRLKGRGKIINISSVSGMLAMPTMASYSASKHALEGASEALWYEMRPLGVNVSLIQPGFINSDSFIQTQVTGASRAAIRDNELPYGDYYRDMGPFIERKMYRSSVRPEKIAKLVLKVIRTEDPPLWVPATPDARFFYYLRRWIPRRWLLPFLFFCLPNSDQWAKSYTQRRFP